MKRSERKPVDKIEPKIENTRPLLSDFFNAEYERGKADALQSIEWSEEDEEIVTGIINDIQERLEDYPTEQLADIYFKEIKWLKSLRPQSRWKPSEKQIEALEDEVRNNKTVFRKKVLNELLEQLKKL